MNEQSSDYAAHMITHWAEQAYAAIAQAAGEYERPSVLYKPKLAIDGNQWCALYGDDLQNGVAGFGRSPEEAMRDFDKNWRAAIQEKQS